MNKLTLLEIMKQLILLYKQGTLTGPNYQAIVENISVPALSEELLSYKETELICFIFKEIPYYQVFTLLNSLCTKLNAIGKENPSLDKKFLIPLIVAYFSDLFINIIGRVNTEINIHIYRLLLQFYQNGTLNPEKTITSLKQNSCTPEILTGLFLANDVLFEQTTLIGFEKERGELREKISKSNYTKRNSIENNVQKKIINLFDEKSFTQFLIAFNTCLDKYHEKDPEDCDLLKDELLLQIKNFYQIAKKAWEKQRKPKENDGYQYQLNLFDT